MAVMIGVLRPVIGAAWWRWSGMDGDGCLNARGDRTVKVSMGRCLRVTRVVLGNWWTVKVSMGRRLGWD